MDEFLKDLLKKKNKNNSLVIDEVLGKIHKKVLSVMSPISKKWLKSKNSKKSSTLSFEILSLEKQTICLLNQTGNTISYHRRYNILLSMCSPQ